MRKKLLIMGLAVFSTFVMASDNASIIKADKAFSTGNITALGRVYENNRSTRIINYLYAKAMLTKSIATPAETFIATNVDDYMRIDLIHQLLIFYFTNHSLKSYIRVFNLLQIKQASFNEKCGYDLANISLGKQANQLISDPWLISNGIPTWCSDLAANKFAHHKISIEQRNIMLFNLLANGRSDTFNEIANNLGLKPINFYRYMRPGTSISSNNKDYQFLMAYMIINIAKNDPTAALNRMNGISLDSNTKTFLNNHLAMQFALKQNFKQALSLFENNDDTYLSNDEYEWRTRSYLFMSDWDNVTKSISDMPYDIQTKNVWLYWNGKASAMLGKESLALQSYKQIPNDYSYYSMLAINEQNSNVTFFNKAAPSTSTSGKYLASARQAFALYTLGKSVKSRNLTNIASAEWNYAAKFATDSELLIMCNMAFKQQLYDIGIAAADQMDIRYIRFSFPTPFLSSYSKYSKINGIDASYALGITRQESRFNYTVIAFDGGVGLMQIMPQTAAYIAHKSKSINCYRSGYDCNIKFGSWYLGNLYSKFNHNLIYATAAYNGGPNRARRWEDNLNKLDNTVQMELIPITITRGYVQKVLTNKAAYDAEFANHNSVNLLKFINNLNHNHYLNQPDDDKTDAGKL